MDNPRWGYQQISGTERPDPRTQVAAPDPPPRLVAGPTKRHDRLGGLIHYYERSAADDASEN